MCTYCAGKAKGRRQYVHHAKHTQQEKGSSSQKFTLITQTYLQATLRTDISAGRKPQRTQCCPNKRLVLEISGQDLKKGGKDLYNGCLITNISYLNQLRSNTV